MSEQELSRLKSLLGATNVNRLLKDIRHIQQYLWEQTFALCLYSRSCYVADDQSLEERARVKDYAQRIKMVDYLQRSDVIEPRYLDVMFDMLLDGDSCPKIIDWYRQELACESGKIDRNDANAKFSHAVLAEKPRKFEEGLAVHAITFTKSSCKHPFSFRQMHLSLTNPLGVFQQLLCLPAPEDLIIKCSLTTLSEYIETEDDPLLGFIQENKEKNFCVADIPDGADEAIKKKSNEKFKIIENAVLEIFESTCEDLVTNPKSNQLHKHFGSQVRLQRNDTKIHIDIDRSYLEAIGNFGEFEAFIDALAGSIQAKHHETESSYWRFSLQPHKTTDCLVSADVLKMMSIWQSSNSMGIIKRLDQCPSIVATILSFDMEHGIGIFDENLDYATGIWDYIDLSNIKSRSGKVQVISDLITAFLSNSPKKWLTSSSKVRSVGPERVLNQLMEKWLPQGESKGKEHVEKRYKRVIELYKKLPKDLIQASTPLNKTVKKDPREFISPRQRVYRQMKMRENNPNAKLPIGSKLAMPFWSAFYTEQKDDQSNETEGNL